MIPNQVVSESSPSLSHHSHTQLDSTIPDHSSSIEEEEEDAVKLYEQYRKELQQLKRDSSNFPREKYIELLETMVNDLIEQNECLVENIVSLGKETGKRVEVMQHQLGTSACRTEEVMLSLESHELELKRFVQKHCCTCCGCDTRTMNFTICHGLDCDATRQGGEHEPNIPSHCWWYGYEWSNTLNQIQAWNMRNGSINDFLPKDAYRSTSSDLLPLIHAVSNRVNQLETENDQLKGDNEMLRQLNALLTGRRDCSHTTVTCIRYEKECNNKQRSRLSSTDSDTLSLNELFDTTDSESITHLNQDLMTFLSKSSKRDSSFFENDSCCDSESRSDSMASRHEVDSGCSADLGHPDECESLGPSHPPDQDLLDFLSPADHSHNSASLQATSHRLEMAERLVPKLYNRLMFYITQRNRLLKQIQLESRQRDKCKTDMAALVDCIQFEMHHLGEVASKANAPSHKNVNCKTQSVIAAPNPQIS